MTLFIDGHTITGTPSEIKAFLELRDAKGYEFNQMNWENAFQKILEHGYNHAPQAYLNEAFK